MKRLELKRISTNTEVTLGVLIDVGTGLPLMVTLELPDRGNQRSISCIPKDIYKVGLHSSDRYKNVFILDDVPGRSGILIHVGNTVSDVEGCILVGESYGVLGGKPAVLNSRKSFKILSDYVDGKGFELLIS